MLVSRLCCAALFGVLATLPALADGVLYPATHGPQGDYHAGIVEGKSFADVDLRATLRRLPGVSHYGLVFRYGDPDNLYRLVLRTGQQDLRVEKLVAGKSDYATTRHIPFASQTNRWYAVRLQAVGPAVKVWIDDVLLYEATGFSELTTGGVGVTVYDNAPPEFDDFAVRDPATDTVLFSDDFNAGNAAGWVAAGAADAKGTWAVREKVTIAIPSTDYEPPTGFHAGPSEGPNRTLTDFPSLVQFRDGRWFTVYIEENQHGTPAWAAMPASGRLFCAWSADAGRTWTPPQPFLDTPVDDRHCYVTQLSDGRLLGVFWIQLVAFGQDSLLNYSTSSSDGGLTWSDPVCWCSPDGPAQRDGKPDPLGETGVTVPPKVAPDGSLYLAVATLGKTGWEAGLIWSRDGGKTWGEYVTIAAPADKSFGYVEVAVQRLASGKWIAVSRTFRPIDPEKGGAYVNAPTYWTTSPDGIHWQPAKEMPLDFTKVNATCPYLLQTSAGVVVFAVNTGVALSYDEGETWVPQDLTLGYYPVIEEVAPNTLASLACAMGGNIVRLTRPTQGAEPQPATVAVPRFPEPLPLPQMAPLPIVAVENVRQLRAIRLRGAVPAGRSPLLRPDDWPLLAVFSADSGGREVVAGVLSDGKRSSWTAPFLIRQADAAVVGLGLAAATDGSSLLTLSTQSAGAAPQTRLLRSVDQGLSWTDLCTLPNVEAAGAPTPDSAPAAWLLPVCVRDAADQPCAAVLRSADDGATWTEVCRVAASFVEPTLAACRDGRWLLLARQVNGEEVRQWTSPDRGQTWTAGAPTGLSGRRPQVVELLDRYFVACVEDASGSLTGGVSWDDNRTWLRANLACGHLVRIAGRKYVAVGSGVDLAGSFNRLQQVPLDEPEMAAAKAVAKTFVAADSAAFTLEGEWTKEASDLGVRLVSVSKGVAKARFSGTGVCLRYAQPRDGRILQVTIDGEEFPPVDTRGPDAPPVSTPLAVGLKAGDHELTLRPLLPWMAGTTALLGVEVIP
jgi:hypothetical protein